MAKRANGSGTIRKRKDGLWEGRMTICIDPVTGKQKQRSFYGKTQKEVRLKMQETAVGLDNGTYIEPSKITLSEWLNRWLETYCTSIRENTRVSYDVQIRVNIVPFFGEIKLKDVDRDMIQRFVNQLSPRLSAKSIKNCYAVLYAALDEATINGYLPRNPCFKINLPSVKKKDIDPLNEDEIRRFLEGIKGHKNECLFKVALFTGMRQAELMGLQWSDVDFNAGTICIRQQLAHEKKKNGAYKLTVPKTEKSIRTIMPAPAVMEWLKERRLNQISDRLSCGNVWDNSIPDLVFTDETGHHMCNTTLTHQATRIGQKIGKPGFRFHDLRHSYAVAAIRAGDDIKTLSTNMGHTTVTITLDLYAGFTGDMAKASSVRMGAYIRNLTA